jgi:DNA-binding NarL/FixJ family response regulator
MRIVFADDAVLIRDGITALLREHGINVVAVACDAPGLLAAVAQAKPDAVIVDIRMPPTFTTEGLVAAERIRAEYPQVGVLLLSMHVAAEYALALINGGRGGVGYLLKERILDIGQVVVALEQLVAGGSVVDPTLVDELMGRQRGCGRLDRLTAREREVLRLMVQGYTNRGIADQLHLSCKTVEAYVTSILGRLEIWPGGGVHRRVRAILAYLSAEGGAVSRPRLPG